MNAEAKMNLRRKVLGRYHGVNERRELLRAEGKLFSTIDEIICESHENSEFMKITSDYTPFEMVACVPCLEDKGNAVPTDEMLGKAIPSGLGKSEIKKYEKRLSDIKSLKTKYMEELMKYALKSDLRAFHLETFGEGFRGTMAYHCELDPFKFLMYENLGLNLEGCGWVIGAPTSKDEITGSDSRGIAPTFNYVTEYTCNVCGENIGEYDPRPKVYY